MFLSRSLFSHDIPYIVSLSLLCGMIFKIKTLNNKRKIVMDGGYNNIVYRERESFYSILRRKSGYDLHVALCKNDMKIFCVNRRLQTFLNAFTRWIISSNLNISRQGCQYLDKDSPLFFNDINSLIISSSQNLKQREWSNLFNRLSYKKNIQHNSYNVAYKLLEKGISVCINKTICVR